MATLPQRLRACTYCIKLDALLALVAFAGTFVGESGSACPPTCTYCGGCCCAESAGAPPARPLSLAKSFLYLARRRSNSLSLSPSVPPSNGATASFALFGDSGDSARATPVGEGIAMEPGRFSSSFRTASCRASSCACLATSSEDSRARSARSRQCSLAMCEMGPAGVAGSGTGAGCWCCWCCRAVATASASPFRRVSSACLLVQPPAVPPPAAVPPSTLAATAAACCCSASTSCRGAATAGRCTKHSPKVSTCRKGAVCTTAITAHHAAAAAGSGARNAVPMPVMSRPTLLPSGAPRQPCGRKQKHAGLRAAAGTGAKAATESSPPASPSAFACDAPASCSAPAGLQPSSSQRTRSRAAISFVCDGFAKRRRNWPPSST